MELGDSPDEAAFRHEVRAWLSEHHPGTAPSDYEERLQFDRDWQRRLHAAGYVGLSWPVEHGGRGLDLMHEVILDEESIRADTPPVLNFAGVEMLGPLLMEFGTQDQCERHLELILSAETIWCQGFSEPGAGSDLASLRTRATKVEGGWRITGQKVWTSYGHIADGCMVLARTDPELPRHKGITMFLMEMEQPGIEVRPLRTITGDSDFDELFLEDAFVPEEGILGGLNNGWKMAMATLERERASSGVRYAAEVRRGYNALMAEASRRGMLADEELALRAAELQIEIEALRLNALRGLTGVLQRGAPGPESSLTKWQNAEISQALGEFAIDLFGADALVDGSVWGHMFLLSRRDSIMGGTLEIQKSIVAERMLGLPRAR
jgi:alkylation response protein AidB-like acyl-CoA dehydrogenase